MTIDSILYPPTIDFHYLWQRPQHLMQAFACLGTRVFYLQPTARFCHKPQGAPLPANLFLLNHNDCISHLNDLFPVFYFTYPPHIALLPRFQTSLVVFDNIDAPLEEFRGWQFCYQQALTRADLVICSSKRLFEESRQINSNTILVPNACDYEHFARAQKRNLSIPPAMSRLTPPLIGYFGTIASWLDWELIEGIAKHFPSCNLVMIGPLHDVFSIPLQPNIHWLGNQPYAALPHYCQLFDAAIIPFRVSKMTEAVNPLKMWEYLAAGLPVVTTALPEAKGYEEIYYSANSQDFLINIAKALQENDSNRKQARMNLASRHNWRERARTILQAMEETSGLRNKALLPSGPNQIHLPCYSSSSEFPSHKKDFNLSIKKAVIITPDDKK